MWHSLEQYVECRFVSGSAQFLQCRLSVDLICLLGTLELLKLAAQLRLQNLVLAVREEPDKVP